MKNIPKISRHKHYSCAQCVKSCTVAMCKAEDTCWEVAEAWRERAVRGEHERAVGTQGV